MAIAHDTLRVGRTYRFTNYGEAREFEVVKRLTDRNYLLKDSLTLEQYELLDLVRYGTGRDYDLVEINHSGEII